MNGFEMMAETYRNYVAKGEMTEEEAKSDIKVFEFLGSCTQEEICKLFDSTAFNEIAKAYFRKAIDNAKLDNCEDKSEIKSTIMKELKWLFDEKKANEVIDFD